MACKPSFRTYTPFRVIPTGGWRLRRYHCHPTRGSSSWLHGNSEPCRRGYPTSTWAADEIVIDGYALEIPQDAPEGEYRIAIGLYEWQTMQRLPVLGEEGQVVRDYALLGTLVVEGGR